MKYKQKQTPLVDALKKYRKERPTYFCIPGHRYENGVSDRWLKKDETGFLAYDLTEATGLDDLHEPEGAIREAQELLADLYGAGKSYFLVNGSTCGNEAMILASVGEGEKILVPANAHKSVTMGLILSGASPIYMNPVWFPKAGSFGGLNPEEIKRILDGDPAIKAVFLVSPDYYGKTLRLKEIAAICHERGVRVLVDEAHGGHCYFHSDLPMGALVAGADMCVQSFHKVTGALTQSSVLHVAAGQDCSRLEAALKMVQSTSPSYLLMASLDAARYEFAVHGEAALGEAIDLAENFREKVNGLTKFHCLSREEVKGENQIEDMDPLRLTISMEGVSGFALQKILRSRFHVETELADFKNILAIVTAANPKEDLDKFFWALFSMEQENEIAKEQFSMPDISAAFPQGEIKLPELSPRQVWLSKVEQLPLDGAIGRIAGEMIIPYPPGIPILRPGERISREVIALFHEYKKRGCHFHGLGNSDDADIKVIME